MSAPAETRSKTLNAELVSAKENDTFVDDQPESQTNIIDVEAMPVKDLSKEDTEEEAAMNKLQEGLAQQRRLIEQLRQEAQITRMRVSQCIDELHKFCETHYDEDVLIKGFAKPSDNPFREKGGCTIL